MFVDRVEGEGLWGDAEAKTFPWLYSLVLGTTLPQSTMGSEPKPPVSPVPAATVMDSGGRRQQAVLTSLPWAQPSSRCDLGVLWSLHGSVREGARWPKSWSVGNIWRVRTLDETCMYLCSKVTHESLLEKKLCLENDENKIWGFQQNRLKWTEFEFFLTFYKKWLIMVSYNVLMLWVHVYIY